MAEEQENTIEIKKGDYTLQGKEVADKEVGGLGITKIGSGRSADVYAGTSADGKKVALKRLVRRMQGMTNDDLVTHAKTLSPAMMKIKGIVTIDDYFIVSEEFNSQRQNVVYYVTELYPEGSLLDALSRKYQENNEWYKKELEIAQSFEYLLNILNILSQVHAENKDHGDLRLQNLLFKEGKVHLNDFSFRKDTEGSKLMTYDSDFEKLVKEAERYFVPKPYGGRDAEESSPQRDIYMVSQAVALGLLTSWQGSRGNISRFNDKIPKEIADIIDRGRAEDPSQRPTAAEFRDAVKNRIGQETSFWVEREADDYYRVSTSERYFENRLKDALEDKVKAADGKALEAAELIDHVGSVYDSCLGKLTAYQTGLLQRLGAKVADSKLKAELEKPKQKLEQLLASYIPQIFEKQLQKRLSGDSQQSRNVPLDDLTAIKTLYDKCNARITGPTAAVASGVRGAMKKKVAEYLPKLLEQKLQFLQNQSQLSTSAFMNIAEFYSMANKEFEKIISKDHHEQLDSVMRKYLSKSAPGAAGADGAAGAGQPQTLWDKFDDRNSQLKRKIDNIDAVLVADEGEVKKRVDDVKTESGERGRTTTQVVDVQNTLTFVRAQLSAFGSFTLTEDTNSDTYKTNKNSEEIKKKIKKTTDPL